MFMFYAIEKDRLSTTLAVTLQSSVVTFYFYNFCRNLRVDGNHGLPGRVTKYADRTCGKFDQLLTHGVGRLIEMLSQ